jgi:hypothetical protein
LRRLRIAGAAAVQLTMSVPKDVAEPTGEQLWAGLSDETQAEVLSLFARLIARSVIIEGEE